DFEVTVVDDGSIDATEDVIRPYLGDHRIRYLRTDHFGQPAAKNAGIRTGTGEFVAFLDADDLWLPTKLERQGEPFCRSGPEVAVVYCPRLWMGPTGEPLDLAQRPPRRGDVLEPLFHEPFICFSSSMIRRRVL